jgi:hypothetical protein
MVGARPGAGTLGRTGRATGAQMMPGRVGTVLTLHHVGAPRANRLQPNRLLEITPRFLERVARALRHSQLDLVSLDEKSRSVRRRC